MPGFRWCGDARPRVVQTRMGWIESIATDLTGIRWCRVLLLAEVDGEPDSAVWRAPDPFDAFDGTEGSDAREAACRSEAALRSSATRSIVFEEVVGGDGEVEWVILEVAEAVPADLAAWDGG